MTQRVRLTRGKVQGLQAVADRDGIIAAAAMDQRGSLRKALSRARGGAPVSDAELTEFKVLAARHLSPHASAILMDPEYGLPAVRARAPGTGVLLAYEKTGYDAAVPGRLPDLLEGWSVPRLLAAGADAVKVLLYYSADDPPAINARKHAFIERVGAECAAWDVPFFLEPVSYSPTLTDEQGLAFAREKPRLVMRYLEEFSRPQYGVDVLKVEVPVNLRYVEGSPAFGGAAAYTRAEAARLFREAAARTHKPFIYLSAGVSDDVFRATLELAAEAGVGYAGVLCGRATWQDGIPVYARDGAAAFAAWLQDRGRRNIEALNAVLRHGARPWHAFYGGLEHVEVVDGPPPPVPREALPALFSDAAP